MSKQDWRELLEYRALGKPEELAKVVEGHWYWADDGYCRCSRCTQKAPVIRQWDDEPMTTMTDFCPNCGAKMVRKKSP